MANRNGPDIPTPDPVTPVPLARTMAYGSGQAAPNAHIVSQLHRLRRGFPFQRAGNSVAPIPQFKALTIYSHTPSNRATLNPNNTRGVPLPFQNTKNPVNDTVYSWPIGARATP